MRYNTKKWLEHIENVIEKGPYKADWDSLSAFRAPKWFSERRFGIFIHWGLYSVPAFNHEWYSRCMYIKDSPEYKHHVETFGEPKDFGYKDFIPLLTAEKFDPAEWIKLFKEAGAGYVFPVAEHHDGFQMYRSELSEWNAYDMGPHRDILGELKAEAEKQDMIFCTSSHRAEHWWFMGHGMEFDSDVRRALTHSNGSAPTDNEFDSRTEIKSDAGYNCEKINESENNNLESSSADPYDFYWPANPEPDNFDMKSEPYPDETFLTDWLIRTVEIIDKFEPALLYFDWWIIHEAFKPYLKKLLAYYYNKGAEWGKQVAVCYKHDALSFGTGIVEIERGCFADAKAYPWQTDTAVARNSWCYTDSLDYKSSYEIIATLIEVVSKNGNLLLNVGPKADGSIPEGDKKILTDIAKWMKINGEAINNSKVWRVSKEGPAVDSDGQFADGSEKVYTSEDIRFTAGHGCIYAFVMKYPEDGRVLIKSLGRSGDKDKPAFFGLIREVSILGSSRKAAFEMRDDGLLVAGDAFVSDMPVVIKIETE